MPTLHGTLCRPLELSAREPFTLYVTLSRPRATPILHSWSRVEIKSQFALNGWEVVHWWLDVGRSDTMILGLLNGFVKWWLFRTNSSHIHRHELDMVQMAVYDLKNRSIWRSGLWTLMTMLKEVLGSASSTCFQNGYDFPHLLFMLFCKTCVHFGLSSICSTLNINIVSLHCKLWRLQERFILLNVHWHFKHVLRIDNISLNPAVCLGFMYCRMGFCSRFCIPYPSLERSMSMLKCSLVHVCI